MPLSIMPKGAVLKGWVTTLFGPIDTHMDGDVTDDLENGANDLGMQCRVNLERSKVI